MEQGRDAPVENISTGPVEGGLGIAFVAGGENCRSLGFPGFPVDLVGVDGLHAVFSYGKPHTRLCPVQRGRKSGFARDDKGWGGASMGNSLVDERVRRKERWNPTSREKRARYPDFLYAAPSNSHVCGFQ